LFYILSGPGENPREARDENWKEHLLLLYDDDRITTFLWPTSEDQQGLKNSTTFDGQIELERDPAGKDEQRVEDEEKNVEEMEVEVDVAEERDANNLKRIEKEVRRTSFCYFVHQLF
jgi:hypothetical protein